MPAPRPRPSRRTSLLTAAGLLLAGVTLASPAGLAQAASSSACEGGGFTVLGRTGDVAGTQLAAPAGSFTVKGKYVTFEVVAKTFEVTNYAFTGAPNKRDMTGGVPTPVWESKEPRHGGTLTSPVTVRLSGDSMALQRTGSIGAVALDMKIQAKDCAAGGIFQMEVGRSDGAKTRFVHRLASPGGDLQPFYFDNKHFRDNAGRSLTADADGNTVACTPTAGDRFCVTVSPRTNIGNDFSEDFVARDSPQGGAAPNTTDRVPHAECSSARVKALGPAVPAIRHCGGISVWDVASGGRMGFVTGEDAVEVANPPSVCVQDCQAQNRVRGRLAVLDFPFPVATLDRLSPRLCTPVRTDCPAHL